MTIYRCAFSVQTSWWFHFPLERLLLLFHALQFLAKPESFRNTWMSSAWLNRILTSQELPPESSEKFIICKTVFFCPQFFWESFVIIGFWYVINVPFRVEFGYFFGYIRRFRCVVGSRLWIQVYLVSVCLSKWLIFFKLTYTDNVCFDCFVLRFDLRFNFQILRPESTWLIASRPVLLSKLQRHRKRSWWFRTDRVLIVSEAKWSWSKWCERKKMVLHKCAQTCAQIRGAHGQSIVKRRAFFKKSIVKQRAKGEKWRSPIERTVVAYERAPEQRTCRLAATATGAISNTHSSTHQLTHRPSFIVSRIPSPVSPSRSTSSVLKLEPANSFPREAFRATVRFSFGHLFPFWLHREKRGLIQPALLR